MQETFFYAIKDLFNKVCVHLSNIVLSWSYDKYHRKGLPMNIKDYLDKVNIINMYLCIFATVCAILFLLILPNTLQLPHHEVASKYYTCFLLPAMSWFIYYVSCKFPNYRKIFLYSPFLIAFVILYCLHIYLQALHVLWRYAYETASCPIPQVPCKDIQNRRLFLLFTYFLYFFAN